MIHKDFLVMSQTVQKIALDITAKFTSLLFFFFFFEFHIHTF
jgi:hypothetical protein